MAEPYCMTLQADKTLCKGCGAADQGLNCWQVPVSPCCQRDRSACATCPVYISHLKCLYTRARVIVGLRDGSVVEALLHLGDQARPVDVLNMPRAFVPLLEPRWLQGSPPVDEPLEVWLVARSQIAWVVPGEVQKAGQQRAA